jgi:hypothetical protein
LLHLIFKFYIKMRQNVNFQLGAQRVNSEYCRSFINLMVVCPSPPRWWLHLIVVRGFEYARDPESYTSGRVAIGRASLAGQVKG